MTTPQSLLTVCTALRDETVVDFVRASVETGYREFFADQQKDAKRLVERAFNVLGSSQTGGANLDALRIATNTLLEEVFRKHDPDFWFNQGYHRYKTVEKPEADTHFLTHLIQGESLLDYGCGSGYLSARLAQAGYRVYTTDVLDYRYAEAMDLPFVQMTSPGEIPYAKGSMDSALVQAVLHHIDPGDLPRVIEGLARTARRVIIKEDTYDLQTDLPGLGDRLLAQPLLGMFVSLPVDSQFHALALIDYYANAVAQGIPEMNMPFEFKSPAEWGEILEANGLQVDRVLLAGFEPGRMHKSCHIWMLAESQVV